MAGQNSSGANCQQLWKMSKKKLEDIFSEDRKFTRSSVNYNILLHKFLKLNIKTFSHLIYQ